MDYLDSGEKSPNSCLTPELIEPGQVVVLFFLLSLIAFLRLERWDATSLSIHSGRLGEHLAKRSAERRVSWIFAPCKL